MTESQRAALVCALPIEMVNFVLLFPPIKGYTAGHPDAFERIRDFEWGILHFPGVWLGIQALHLPAIGWVLGFLIAFLDGYLETALLILLIIYCIRGCIRLIRYSSHKASVAQRGG